MRMSLSVCTRSAFSPLGNAVQVTRRAFSSWSNVVLGPFGAPYVLLLLVSYTEERVGGGYEMEQRIAQGNWV